MGELSNQLDVHNKFKAERSPRRREAEVREHHRRSRSPRRRWRGTSRPSARGGVRGTGDKKTMALAAQLYEKVVDELQAGAVREVRVPAHRQGRLAEHLQDQVRDGRPPLLPEGLGQVRPGVRLRRRRGPERPAGRRGRVRLGALLPEHLHRDAQGRLGQEGRRQPPRRQEEREGQEGRRRRRSSRRRTSPTTRRG